MRSRRSGVSIIAHESDIYAVGGFDGTNRLKTTEVYDATDNAWRALSQMINPRSNFGVEVRVVKMAYLTLQNSENISFVNFLKICNLKIEGNFQTVIFYYKPGRFPTSKGKLHN